MWRSSSHRATTTTVTIASASRTRSSSSSLSSRRLLCQTNDTGTWHVSHSMLTKNRRSHDIIQQKNHRNKSSTTTTTTAAAASTTTSTDDHTSLSKSQMYSVFLQSAIPMIGFGFMDQTVMLQAGNAIDCSIGVTFGLSTLSAAALGQVCSDASGVLFGNTVERMLSYFKIVKPIPLTSTQHTLPITSRLKFLGTLVGVILGCSLGLLNLLFIDTTRSSTLKLQAYVEGGSEGDGNADGVGSDATPFFEIEASNDIHDTATALIVKGPDVDGLLASMTATLALQGCSIVEIHASKAAAVAVAPVSATSKDDNKSSSPSVDDTKTDQKNTTPSNTIHDIIYVVKQGTYEKYEDDELEELAQALLDSTKLASGADEHNNILMIHNTIQTKVKELEASNMYLKAKIKQLEEEREWDKVFSTKRETKKLNNKTTKLN